MSFLNAEWRKLALANYEVDPDILLPRLPPKTELDLWNGTCYVSLVGFMFLNTRLLGMPIPFHRNFEEVNLRFYVRYKDGDEWKRGVVFVSEIVPKPALTFVANTVYKEHYQTMKMSHSWEETDQHRIVSYRWQQRKQHYEFKVTASLEAQPLVAGSETEFITEHYWGYTHNGKGGTYEYQVTHPRWECYEVVDHAITADFGALYGPEFAHIDVNLPLSVMLAEGSEITVESKRTL